MRQENPSILQPNENVELAYRWTRDHVYFTSLRILYKDKKGITGQSIGWQSIPYTSIKAFSAETAGVGDFDMEISIWPSGMEKVEMGFKSGAVDVYAIQRLLNSKVFHPERIGMPEQVIAQEQSERGKFAEFLDLLGDDARQLDPKVVEAQLKHDPPILDNEEAIELAYRCGRDSVCITDRRFLFIDVKGIFGKKVEYMSILWKSLSAFSIETPGAFLDRDAEMKIWTNISGYDMRVFEQDLRKGSTDVMAVQQAISNKMLGADTEPPSQEAVSMQGAVDTGGGWQSWMGDQRMIDATAADRQFHTTTPILQGSEHVEMAFKGKRDMMLFTTKRLLIVNVKGWSGKKVNYLSVPWRAIQCFAVETAGSFLDMDAEMKLWTDIFYDPPPPHGENENPPPEPGMSFIEQNFQKDKVDIMAVLRYLATRCAQIGTDSSQLSAVPIAPEVLSASPPDAIEQFLGWLGDARQIDPAVLDQQLHTINPVLLDSEHAVMGFTAGRDTLVLTTHRVLAIDVQGITGKKVEYQSVPWTKVRGFSATSAGSWDTDAELKFYLKAPWLELHSGCISQDLRKGRADIVAIQSFAAAQTFGACDGSSVVPGSGASDAGSGVVQFLNWLGDNSHQIDAAAVNQMFHSSPAILLGDENVDLAFKCGRDLVVYTTKRILFVDVQGFTGKKVEYVSVPFRQIAPFEVESAGGMFDVDATVRLFTECPATDKVKQDIARDKGDLNAVYNFCIKKLILDKATP